DQVVALLMSSGRTLPRTADLYRTSTSLQAAPAIRRLWFHDALSSAWSQNGLHSGESSWSSSTTVTSPMVCTQGGQTNCPSPLPSIGSVPWDLPQPGSDPCPTCSISSGPPSGNSGLSAPSVDPWTINLQIAPKWGGGCLITPVVTIDSPGFHTQMSVPL